MKEKLSKKILLATIKIGAEKGIENINIKMIGDQCGVSSAAMYYHFKNKYDLIFKATFYVVKQLAKVVKTNIIPEMSFKDNYMRVMKAIARYDLDHPEESIFYNRMLIVPSLALNMEDYVAIVSYCPLVAYLHKAREEGIIIDIPNVLSLAYYPLCTLLMHYIMQKSEPPQELIDEFIRSLWVAISLDRTADSNPTPLQTV